MISGRGRQVHILQPRMFIHVIVFREDVTYRFDFRQYVDDAGRSGERRINDMVERFAGTLMQP